MNAMRISQLAEHTGVPATTLRFYEGAGLLPADRTPAGYRVYGQDAVERLAFIGAAKHLGLRLEQIAELLTVWESGACAEVKADLRPRLVARLAQAEHRAAQLAAFTASLLEALRHLDSLPERTQRCDPACGYFTSPAPMRRSTPVAVMPSDSRKTAERDAYQSRTAPVACSLTAEGIAERTAAWREALTGARHSAIEDGLRMTLPAQRAGTLATLAAAEQQCCPFYDFRLHLDGPTVHLEVRAPAEGLDLLTNLFARSV